MKPLVSIRIALYNHENFIVKTLDSILEDTYENKEVVMIDDGSTDNSHKLVLDWIKKNEGQIKIIYKSRENRGLSKTLVELAKLCNGKYTLPIASDDYLINNTIEKRVDILEMNPDKLMLLSDAIVVDNKNNKIYESGNFELMGGNKKKYFTDKGLKNEILFNWSIVGPSYFLNNKIYEVVGFNDPDIYLEDWDYAVRSIAKNVVIFYDEKVAAYRLHENNTIKNKDAAIKFSESCIKTIEKHGHKFSLSDRLRLWNKARRLKRKVKRLKNGN